MTGTTFCERCVLNELDGDRHLADPDRKRRADGVVVALEMVEDSDQRQEGESAEAVLMRRALTTPPMTITKAER